MKDERMKKVKRVDKFQGERRRRYTFSTLGAPVKGRGVREPPAATRSRLAGRPRVQATAGRWRRRPQPRQVGYSPDKKKYT